MKGPLDHPEARLLLAGLARGGRLRDARDLEGVKRVTFELDGEARAVSPEAVAALVAAGLIDSNKKFPSATYWLTEAGKRAAAARALPRQGPLNTD
ncbi:MAG: hypothetical protein K1X39_13930 [Thermoflexales bacterium]|nr:hypothetical protein [Thermoflexales bacterium]